MEHTGANLHVIKTTKFKNTLITIKFKNELNRSNTSIRALLAMTLLGGTKHLTDQKQLASYLEECYGANLSSNISTKGKAQIIHLTSSFVNEKFLPIKEDLFKKQVDLMADVLFHPLFENGLFTDKVLKQKKRELKDRLLAIKDDKYSYALDQLLDFMGKDTTLGISGIGYLEDIDNITKEQVTDALRQMIREDSIELYVIGDITDEQIQYLKQQLSFTTRITNYEAAYSFASNRTDVQEVIEKQDITQSKFNMGFVTNVNFLDDKHEAMTIMNGILGAFSHSRLFKNVREKHSLCYYIGSSFDAFNGVLLVSCGIEAKDASKVKELVMKEIEELQNGHISDEEIEITKRMFENSITKSQDEAGATIGLLYNRDLVNKKETIQEYLDRLMAVTKEEIVSCANLLKLDTTFLLEGGKEDGQETL